MADSLREKEKEKDESLSEGNQVRHGLFLRFDLNLWLRGGLVERLVFIHDFGVLLEGLSVTIHGSSSCNT